MTASLPGLPVGVAYQNGSAANGSTPTSHLPAPLSCLIGREEELETIQRLVLDPQVRLVTLIGAPGVGKTRLALAVGHRMRDAFADDVWFVPLAPVQRTGLVVSTIAHGLGVHQARRGSALDAVARTLAGRRLLLVLDNFEHLLAAAPTLAQVLTACRGVTMLVTSRASLRISGEHLVQVAPLAGPTLCPLPAYEELATIPSVQLLVQRAAAAAPGFRMTPSNAQAVAELCVRLDGLPLAIELAAARCGLLDPAQLLARLDGRPGVLSDGPRDAPARQRTLHAAIDWSYTLLTSDQQRLFRRLAVFVGGCTLDAAEAVAWPADERTFDVLDGLASLIDQSLLHKQPDPDGVPRVSMLETIREFSLERLAVSGELETIRSRHASYFADLAELAASPRLDGADGRLLLARLACEQDNLRAALQYFQDRCDHGRSLQMAGALWSFWELHDDGSEGLTWLEGALKAHPAVSPPIRARALIGMAALLREKGDYFAAEALARESAAIRRAFGDEVGLAESLLIGSDITALTGDPADATTLATECLEIRSRRHDVAGAAWAMVILGHILMSRADFLGARGQYEAALSLRKGKHDNLVDGWILRGLGALCAGGGELGSARLLLEEALELFRAHCNTAGTGSSLLTLGDVALQQGDPIVGHGTLEEAEALLAQGGHAAWHAAALLRLGHVPIARLVDDFGRVPIVAGWRVALGREIPSAFGLNTVVTQRNTRAMTANEGTADGLTRREREVLALVAQRYSNREIADALVLSRRTVERHLANIFSKLDVSSRRQAAVYSRQHSLGPIERYIVPPA